ncbi:SAM-dependent methyltransferase [Williamsia sp.]|uniref:SAM-dependent methyltransferase n=1 Tax=Williamsia sp. TaxID=1872085 RepID=UPI001A26E7EA|nr:SAM-dependent methyltransferase [Williamsia sp.]MBJ7287548.1 SAM-dependent methyltransferase [Williamsia sp.]
MGVEISSVGTTAVLVAQMRALESARTDRLFTDELAHELVTAAAMGIENVTLEQVEGQRVYVSVSVRTHYLDAWCSQLLSPNAIRQVVILGAGLDTRAIRLNWLDDGLSVFEIDRSDVTELKAQVLGIDPDARWRGLATDLATESWSAELHGAGFDPTAPTLFIAEGLFMYLDDVVSTDIIAQIEKLSAPGSHLLGVHFGRGALIDAETQAMSAAIGKNGYGFESVIDTTPDKWLGDSWDVLSATSIAQYAPTVGRKIPYDEDAIGAEVTWMFAASLSAAKSQTSSDGSPRA